MLAKARSRLIRHGGRARIARGSATGLAAAAHDAVFGFAIIHYIPDWRGAWPAVRVLKPGGRFFFDEVHATALARPTYRAVQQGCRGGRTHMVIGDRYRFGDIEFLRERDRGGAMREFVRGAIRLHILHHAAEEELHGAWMTRELATHGYHISPGTLYPTLHRLEADGLLVSRQQVVEGRTRRVYRATEAGRRVLEQDRAALAELAREVLGAQIPR